jgi:hypothetical protein
MQEMLKFRMHWQHEGKMYLDELVATSKVEAVDYFNDNKRSDVSLVRVELIGSDEGGVREYAHPPDAPSPYRPLVAWRRSDKDNNT